MANETIVLGGGCFWCTEVIYKNIRGVVSVTSGYAGGNKEEPTYEQVCTGETGHAEAVKIEFDASKISLHDIFEVFFASHDPTTLNSQGPDTGTQYRSIILYTNEEQKEEDEKYIQQLNESKQFSRPIVTEIEPLTKFWPAEDYHADYFNKNRAAPYCQAVIDPKVNKFKQKYKEYLNE